MISGGCTERIQRKYPKFTKTETKLANYILNDPNNVLQLNVSELAKNAGVSDASVVRFSRNIGYHGFMDFKVNLAYDVVPSDRHINPRLKKGDAPEDICRKIFESEVRVLNETRSGMSVEQINRITDKIAQADHIVLFGTGGSLMVIKDAEHKFLKIGYHAIVHEDIDMQRMEASLMRDRDVAIAVSFSGANSNVIDCMKMARANNAYCVGIVSQVRSPLTKVVDDAVYSAYDETIFNSESVSTRIAQLAIIDCIVSVLSIHNYDNAKESIHKTREATTLGKY